MASIFDVADYILFKTGFVSTMKLQKLAFYSQAYSLAKSKEPLFQDDFEAWVNGPVCHKLFSAHRGLFVIGRGELNADADANRLANADRAIVDKVVERLGDKDGETLSSLTHSEKPWQDARGECGDFDRCNAVISKQSIQEFYSSPACANPLFA